MLDSIDTVTFDLWQTLVIDNRELGRARTRRRLEKASQALKEAGHEFSSEHIQEAYRDCYRACRQVHNQGKDFTFDEQVRIFIDFIDNNLTQRLNRETTEFIIHWYAEAFFDFPPPVAPEAKDVLAEIAKRGYRMGMISNTGMTPGRVFRRYLEQFGMLDFFQALTFSDEVELSKPSPEIFHMTLKALGTSPKRSVHVGDHIANDVVGARQAGMRVVLLGEATGQDRVTEPHIQVQSLSDIPRALEELATAT